nr:glutathione synthetase [Hymenolepis microstoma]
MDCIKRALSKLSDNALKNILKNVHDFAALNGILKLTPDGHIVTLQHTFLPSPFPKAEFEEAVNIQQSFNSLFLKVASDYDFLESVFKPVLSQDDYVRNLWEIYKTDQLLGPVQSLRLSLNRSDYMLHTALPGSPLKQVEMNFIAASFGGVMERLVKAHQFRLHQLLGPHAPQLPECPSATKFGLALARTVAEYSRKCQNLPQSNLGHLMCEIPAILVVISDCETNIFDQRSIEEAVLYANPSIPILRCTFAELAETTGRAVVESETGRLIVDGHEVGIIYYRTGYAPDHFNEEAWKTKLRLERSLAVKCPSVDYLLANMKLVQTALASGPAVLSRFGNGPEVEKLARTFAKQTVLSTDFHFADVAVIDCMVTECRKNPSKFVLKPQREGGSNNTFGDDIVHKLDEIMGKPEANAYILMERFEPPLIENCVVGADYAPPIMRKMVSELGIYGILLSDGKVEMMNDHAGHLLRTKFVGVDEGGVVTGFASLDTPLLV